MEIIFEILFEIIVDGSLNTVSDKKIPLPLRILAAIVLLIVYGGLVCLCLFWGIRNKNFILMIVGLGLLFFQLGIHKDLQKSPTLNNDIE